MQELSRILTTYHSDGITHKIKETYETSVVSRAENAPIGDGSRYHLGSPGTGKSAVLHQLPRAGIALRDIRALGSTRWICVVYPSLRMAGRVGQRRTLSLKWKAFSSGRAERCTRDVQGSCYQLVLDRKLGEYTLPEDGRSFAAGNRIRTGLLRPGCPRLADLLFISL